MKIRNRKDLAQLKKHGEQQLFPRGVRITVGLATCGIAKGAAEVYAALKRELKSQKFQAALEDTGCGGLCSREPIVTVQAPGAPLLTFADMQPSDAPALVRGLKTGEIPLDKILCRTDRQEDIMAGGMKPFTGGKPAGLSVRIAARESLPFFKHQKRIALRNCGFTAPVNLSQYIARGGFSAALFRTYGHEARSRDRRSAALGPAGQGRGRISDCR